MSPDFPHIICITEHHMNSNEINFSKFDNYNLGAQFCRENNSKGGVAIYIYIHTYIIAWNFHPLIYTNIVQKRILK